MSITDIVANIDQRLADLDAELTHLNGARAALINKSAPQPAQASATKARRARRTPAKRAYDIVPAGKLLAMLAKSGPMTTRDLSQRANADPRQVLPLLKQQQEAGEVRRSGTRAATRWHTITDEDRIAARVAELEASSRRTRARKN
jgi:hypothetical protein